MVRQKVRIAKRSPNTTMLRSVLFQETRKINITVSGPILQKKANEFAEVLTHDIRASNGWVYNLKKSMEFSKR